ncbi:unnamed protein product [Rotaria sp. Silwood2]|nr:unnamed protein product [Rotaria sp. Silwood2]CAF4195427.1 unnamed protein product [Rotaria sp. Silwood2]
MATCKYSFNALRRASSSAAVASTVNQRNVPQTKTGQFGVPQRVNLPKESINVTKLSNGMVVASMENNSPIFRVAAVVDAGAKYEPYEMRGVTTLLRVFSNLVILY